MKLGRMITEVNVRSEASAGDELLDGLQRATFAYIWNETNAVNGLVADRTEAGSPASIAVVGFALAAYPVAVERGFVAREAAVARTLATLRFFRDSPQGPATDATGYRGFYYHFLEMSTGRRIGRCELSTMDTALLIAGMLSAAIYFDREVQDEVEIRSLADALYRRVDWRWAQHRKATMTHGWTPEHGFLKSRWEGYDEALLLYVLGLGSPTDSLPVETYAAWASTFSWRTIYGYEYLYAGPLFMHQFSHAWIDFRGIQDGFMRDRGLDYFENSRRATYVQQQYAIQNPLEFDGYGAQCWGITASDGPGPATRRVKGVERRFFAYHERGVPNGPDDGTLAPWAVAASLPFAPEIAVPALRSCRQRYPEIKVSYGFPGTFNPTYSSVDGEVGSVWVCQVHHALNQAPNILTIENHRSGLPWRLMRRCAYLATGLRRAGFANGWL